MRMTNVEYGLGDKVYIIANEDIIQVNIAGIIIEDKGINYKCVDNSGTYYYYRDSNKVGATREELVSKFIK